MAVVIVTKPDPFSALTKSKARRLRSANASGTLRDYSHVRRPYRGILTKEDTYASLEVIRSDGTLLPLLNAGARDPIEQLEALEKEKLPAPERTGTRTQISEDMYTVTESSTAVQAAGVRRSKLQAAAKKKGAPEYLKYFLEGKGYSLRNSNFLITSVSEMRQEKYQIMETFGNPFIFFFGQRPMIFQYTGILLDSADFQWKNEFWENYETVLRGTRLVEADARVHITYGDVLVEGYILDAKAGQSSQYNELVEMTFQFFVTQYTCLADLGNRNFPRPLSVAIDATYLAQNRTAELPQSPSSTSDRVLRANFEAEATQGSVAGMGPAARALASALEVADAASRSIDKVVRGYQRIISSNSLRYPVGVIPTLSQIQGDPAVSGSLGDLESSGDNLVRLAQQDPAGAPTWAVTDSDLAVNLTRRYLRLNTGRRIRVLPPGGKFYPQDPTVAAKTKFSDNLDEYVQSPRIYTTPVTDELSPYKDKSKYELPSQEEISQAFVNKLRQAGMGLSREQIQEAELRRRIAQGALTIGLYAGRAVFDSARLREQEQQAKERAEAVERATQETAPRTGVAQSQKVQIQDIEETPTGDQVQVKVMRGPQTVKKPTEISQELPPGVTVPDTEALRSAQDAALREGARA